MRSSFIPFFFLVFLERVPPKEVVETVEVEAEEE